MIYAIFCPAFEGACILSTSILLPTSLSSSCQTAVHSRHDGEGATSEWYPGVDLLSNHLERGGRSVRQNVRKGSGGRTRKGQRLFGLSKNARQLSKTKVICTPGVVCARFQLPGWRTGHRRLPKNFSDRATVQQDIEGGTIGWWISDSRASHTTVSTTVEDVLIWSMGPKRNVNPPPPFMCVLENHLTHLRTNFQSVVRGIFRCYVLQVFVFRCSFCLLWLHFWTAVQHMHSYMLYSRSFCL